MLYAMSSLALVEFIFSISFYYATLTGLGKYRPEDTLICSEMSCLRMYF